jgi:response regulator NasT
MSERKDTGPNRPLRILVADVPSVCQKYQEWLPTLGHQVVGVAHTGRELIARCQAERPDLVITEIDLPGMDGVVASIEINRDRDRQVPVILVAVRRDAEVLERFGVDHIMAYLSKPVKPVDLAAAIRLAVVRFGFFLEAVREAAGLGEALADRMVIERARDSIMRQAGLSEKGAIQRLQRLADEKGQRLIEVARAILIAAEVLQPPGQGS